MICENCGKEHDGHFGSGRYCSRACANSRHHSTETKQKISESIKKEIICYCQFCNKEFKNLTSKQLGWFEKYKEKIIDYLSNLPNINK